jgi:hypothetical protein
LAVDIVVFRFIIEYTGLGDIGPTIRLFLYKDF